VIGTLRRIVSPTAAPEFYLDPERLEALAEEHADAYSSAEPFPHAVIDDLLPAEVLERVLDEFPGPDHPIWRKFEHEHSKKLALLDETRMPPFTRDLLYQLNGGTFIRFLERLTGIHGLVPDPHFEGGGLHQIQRGGRLEVHADFNWHQLLRLDRRLNMLVYLNKDWQDSYGGYLELWDREMTRCVERIAPLYNRCVVFSTTDFSHHGHPHPLACPPGMTRKSLALYYYTNGRPDEERSDPHSTLYQKRPGSNSGDSPTL
jgi:Rps23 Pro-64 3,4-dihydroxylase Tpa1-like proline 4-hydroxylase